MYPAPGLHDVLGELKASYRLAMATNRSNTVGRIVKIFGLDRYMELAIGLLEAGRPKPHPDLLNKCLEHFEVAPSAAVYIGDADTDLIAANAAGMHFVAVGEVPGAEIRVRDLRELPGQLDILTQSGNKRKLET
jgi:HAD superfamily hydrolase (TIGR01509 family)